MPRRDRGNQETNVAKMTKQQALDKLDKAVGKVADEGLRRIEANLPKLKASAKKLAEQLKADESPELIDTQSKHLKLQMRAVGEGTLLLDEAIRRLKEFEKDDELFELVADEMTEAMLRDQAARGRAQGACEREEAARPGHQSRRAACQRHEAGAQGMGRGSCRSGWALCRLPEGDQGLGRMGQGHRGGARPARQERAVAAAEGQAGLGGAR